MVVQKTKLTTPAEGSKTHLHTLFCLHTVTMDCSDRVYGYFLRDFYVLIETYPLVPSPPSVRETLSDYRLRVRRWEPVTLATNGCGGYAALSHQL